MAWFLLATGLILLWLALISGQSKALTPRPAETETRYGGPKTGAETRAGGYLLSAFCGLLAAGLFWPFQNGVALVSAAAAGAAFPSLWSQSRRARRRRQVTTAVGEMLRHLTAISHTYRLPVQALGAALDAVPPSIRPVYQQALAAHEAGVPLPEALRTAAEELDGNFYAYQLAELVRVSIHSGAEFSQALTRLLQRYQTVEELRAEERTATSGYAWFIRAFAFLSVAPALWWRLTNSPNLIFFQEGGFPRFLLGWTVLAALACSLIPALLSVEDV